MKKVKNLALVTMISLIGCTNSKHLNSGMGIGGVYNEEIVLSYPSDLPKIRSNKEIVVSNLHNKLIKLEASGTYKHVNKDDDIYNLFYLNLDGGIRWKKTPKYTLSSGFSLPIQGIHLEWDNFGTPKKDLEVVASWDWVPLSIEYFLFPDVSLFGSGKIRYHYLNSLRFSIGAKVYLNRKRKNL